MQNTRRARTESERSIRGLLRRRGLRFRSQCRLTGLSRRTVDFVLTQSRTAVFVDGCFWHLCPWHGTLPKANRDWWRRKLERNRARDRDTDRRLRAMGWLVVRVWEHAEPGQAA